MAPRPIRIFILLILLFHFTLASAQLFPTKDYPQGYFTWPVVAKQGLVANFGELRSNHYHMGLDMRTDQKVNVRVNAAADGYVAKVKIEPFGFGRCIYINHPNGFTTVYAHLNDFEPKLEKYIREQQYKLQQWKVFLDIPPQLFPVRKGEFIAYSGNTGGSQGPHVHFEIRQTATDKVLNPMLFGFPVADNVAPVILRLAVYDRSYSTYEQSPRIIALKKVNGVYRPLAGNISVPTDKVSFAIGAYDCVSGSNNPNGIFGAELSVEGQVVCGFQMDEISYDETRYMNAHIDYKTKAAGGPYLQHLSRLPGFINSIYREPGGDGVINLPASDPQQVSISVSDPAGNRSQVEFNITSSGNSARRPVNGPLFLPNQVNVFEDENLSFYLPENAIYDSFRFNYKAKMLGAIRTFDVQTTGVPVQTYFPIKIFTREFNMEDTGKIIMKRFLGTKDDYKKASYENGGYRAYFREFGNFQLILDKQPPVIRPIGFHDGMNVGKLRRIAFAVSDNTEEIANFTAKLDGQWLLFSNDKGKVFVYEFDEYCSRGPHELSIIVEDLAGNRTEKTYRFTR